jgi:tryptophan 7-halogenase
VFPGPALKFVTGRYERPWVKNVVAVGNASGFGEPLESTSVGVICLDSFALAETLADCDLVVRPTQVKLYNRRSALLWHVIRSFLAIHFKLNTRLQTPYWRACVEDADLCGAEQYVEYYRENGPSLLWRQLILDPRNPFGIEGYVSMMLGMNLPYHKTYIPDANETQVWHDIYQRLQAAAGQALTVDEALSCIRQPWWQWPVNLYNDQ